MNAVARSCNYFGEVLVMSAVVWFKNDNDFGHNGDGYGDGGSSFNVHKNFMYT